MFVVVDDVAGRWLQLIRTTDSVEHANVSVNLQGDLRRRVYIQKHTCARTLHLY